MVKRKNRSKRSLGSLPKGLPLRGSGSTGVNPFETTQRQKRPKHHVHNRHTSSSAAPTRTRPSALAQALQRRKTALKDSLQKSKKDNVFADKRIGEYDPHMTVEEQNLARLVRERSRRSKRMSKYSLDDNNDSSNDNAVLTHKGKAVDSLKAKDHIILSDDEEEEIGDLDAVDTEMHFGGGNRTIASSSIYGPASSTANNLSNQYQQRKTELDDLIMRRKMQKAEKMQSKEAQVEAFEKMDDSFKELSSLLSFRDKEQQIRDHLEQKRAGKLSKADQEMEDWNREMKTYLYTSERRVKATDRTKTAEEIAKEEHDRLHEMETRRLARMNGDFSDDDFDDISDDDDDGGDDKRRRKKKKTRQEQNNPEALHNDSDDDDDSENEVKMRFTADGLVKVNKDGVVVGKVGDEPHQGNPNGKNGPVVVLKVGERVSAMYRAKEQFEGDVSWFDGVVSSIHKNANGSITYNVDYDDGDFEEGVEPRHIKAIEKTKEELEKEVNEKDEQGTLKRKRKKAKDKARTEIPFVFEVPTSLDALHDMIAKYASTGEDASLIIRRIHAANSVRLDRRNMEKMQNFYDVLLRRFVAVGDAIHHSGDGGAELGRYRQLDAITEVMYIMAQDSPESAGAVWSRRLGFFQNGHAKRLRDAGLERDDDDDDEEDGFTAWPSTGVFLLLRALGHIFPVTDKRHHVVTPALLFLGQIVAHTPILQVYDLVMGTLFSGLLIEYTKEAKRVAPEAHAFLASVIRLFAHEPAQRRGSYPLPTVGIAVEQEDINMLRSRISKFEGAHPPKLSLERSPMMQADTLPAALLFAILHLVELSVSNLAGSVSSAEKELFAEITASLLALKPRSKTDPLPDFIQQKVGTVAAAISDACQLDEPRIPVQRRLGPSIKDMAIKSLAPRLENPDKYSMSKDKGKSATQAAADRTRRELKREHKAISRELRLDAVFIESERRCEQDKRDSTARAKRQKAFSWLESEQAAMNQQVRQGGGLLKGGGIGAAKDKAASAKLGIKKGGKF